MKLENKIQKEVIDYLKKNRIYHFRFQAQVNLNGIPDIIVLYKGYMLGIELKKEDGEPTDLQRKKLQAINENGGIGVIIKSVSQLASLIKYIDSLKS